MQIILFVLVAVLAIAASALAGRLWFVEHELEAERDRSDELSVEIVTLNFRIKTADEAYEKLKADHVLEVQARRERTQRREAMMDQETEAFRSFLAQIRIDIAELMDEH